MLMFGSTTVLNVFTGCGHSNFGFMPEAHGLVGLGGGPLSLATQLRVHGCLLDAVLPMGTTWIPLFCTPKIETYYFVGLSGLGIGDMQLPIPQNSFKRGAIIDLCTAYTRLPRLVYEAFRNAYLAKIVILPQAPVTSMLDSCYNLSSLESLEVPNVSFFFLAEPILTLLMWNILVEQEYFASEGIFCFAFVPTNDTTSVIGNTQLVGIYTSFDAEVGYVGFGLNICGPLKISPLCHGH
ncbi:protein ASPARTIC PROTEASE IN GUARD CELL 2-like [Corylus avellana]|uniref:protein ASPARTIC PROTEASE IN GUARD CELL 2-like n=1 Tax=Corylus avellana TaxID=13451 RepID=UPI00286B048B|nr:protein ASPARTIC PROTEASE IN GUARD CELL 2-like [Corylus avellana]